MIKLTNVKKSFGETVAIDGISIDIKPGEIVGLLGPNGAGKTTILRILAGVLPQSSGKVIFDGKNFSDDEFYIKKRIGYLPENNPLYEEFTVEEHLNFWTRMKGIGENEEKDAIVFAVEKTGIESVYYRIIGELSKGFRQRVGLAQAILAQPEILLLDEPTEGLDPNQRRDIQQLLSDLKESRTVIVSSHVLGEISKLASRMVIIHQGKVVGDDSPKKLIQQHSDGKLVRVEVTGKAILTSLKSLKGVLKAKKVGKQVYELAVSAKKDIRSDIFEMAVKKKWKLLEVNQIERQLEDVFSELTEV